MAPAEKQLWKGILLIVLCTLFTSAGQILLKLGLREASFAALSSFVNIYFFLGLGTYGAGAVLLLAAFRQGELSILYPVIATSYVWVCLFSPLIFSGDSMNGWKWAGVAAILVSVSLLGFSSSKKNQKEVVQ